LHFSSDITRTAKSKRMRQRKQYASERKGMYARFWYGNLKTRDH
jgi:hypothetical protein